MYSKPLYRIFIFVIAALIILQALSVTEPDNIDNIDGYGLLQKPPALSKTDKKKDFEQGLLACQSECVTPSGKLLGISSGVKAFSNCKSTCIQSDFSFLNLTNKTVSIHKPSGTDKNQHYIGLIYQCVEYARRWWMKNDGITFGDIDSAYDIIYLNKGKNIYTNQDFPLARSINGSAKRAPQRGDLLIYYPDMNNPKWRFGHVAVIVDVDLMKGTVSLAEQNYKNQLWENPDKFSRQIRLFEIGGRYQLLDISTSSNKNLNGGLIAGWVYPASRI